MSGRILIFLKMLLIIVDNIKYIGLLAENASFDAINDIDEIEIDISVGGIVSKFNKKKVKIVSDYFPRFNSSSLLKNIKNEN